MAEIKASDRLKKKKKTDENFIFASLLSETEADAYGVGLFSLETQFCAVPLKFKAMK